MTEVLPPLVGRADREVLLAAARAENLPIDLDTAAFDDGGWENAVLATADGWILRFPRGEQVPFGLEMALLHRLRGRLTVPIPEVTWRGRHVRMAVYRKLTGSSFSAEAYLRAPAQVRDRLARSLVAFLVSVHHSLTPAECAALGVTPVDHHRTLGFVVSHLSRIPAAQRSAVRALAERFADVWTRSAVPGPHVLLHNDFHTGNLVLSDPVGELTGVWDFSCVQTGVPTYELRYFEGGPRDLFHRLADRYTEVTGAPIDLDAAMLAHRMENVSDALELGRMELIGRAFRDGDAGRE